MLLIAAWKEPELRSGELPIAANLRPSREEPTFPGRSPPVNAVPLNFTLPTRACLPSLKPRPSVAAKRVYIKGTIGWVIEKYWAADQFTKQKAENTKRNCRRVLDSRPPDFHSTTQTQRYSDGSA